MKNYLLLSLLMVLQISCITSKQPGNVSTENQPLKAVQMAGPQVLVYKTRKEYTNHVPVLLSADKTKVVSYPAPSDIKGDNGHPRPLQLQGGYWLDERGIGLNVAFLKLTYEEYALLPVAPSKAELMELILDPDPLTELCNCGSRNAYDNIKEQLNQLILSGELRQKCTIIK